MDKSLKLQCLLNGEVAPFPIKVDDLDTVTVGDLKQMIAGEKKNTITCAPNHLKLYLALKDEQWLSDELTEKTEVQVRLNSSNFMCIAVKLSFYFNDKTPTLIDGTIHVLVVVPENHFQDRAFGSASTFDAPYLKFQRTIDTLNHKVDTLNHKVDILNDTVDSLNHKVDTVNDKIYTVNYTVNNKIGRLQDYLETNLPHKRQSDRGRLGDDDITRLKRHGLVIDVAPVQDKEAFWSQAVQQIADAIEKEDVFDAFITPFFNSVLANYGMTFVNTKRYPWMPRINDQHLASDLEPGGFAHLAMFSAKNVPNDKVNRPPSFRFGVAKRDLFDCPILFESKLKISRAAFHQVARYFQHLYPDTSACAILFDRRSFWLINGYKANIENIKRANWVDGSSKALFKEFIAANIPPWVEILKNACSLLGVDLDSDAYLGRGACGLVFKVTKNGENFALKIVEDRNTDVLYREASALKKAKDTGLTIHAVGNCVEVTGGAALLLSPVGIPLPQPASQRDVANLFCLLWELHKLDLIHGDPHVSNVIVYKEKPLWIDLVEVEEASPALRKKDVEILIKSILYMSWNIDLAMKMTELIEKYSVDPTLENINRLATQVYHYVI